MACLNPRDPITIRIFSTDGAFHTILSNNNGGMRRDGVLVRARRKRRKELQTGKADRHAPEPQATRHAASKAVSRAPKTFLKNN